jgi:hypothetical protein
MKRVIVSAVLAFGLVGAWVGVAGASEPNNQACVGETLSVLAANQPEEFDPGSFGNVITIFAQAPDGQPGLGDGIQTLEAGLVPDAIAPNTCND